jgi:hypothetical protein
MIPPLQRSATKGLRTRQEVWQALTVAQFSRSVPSRTHALRGAVKVCFLLAGYLRKLVQERCAAALERLAIAGCLLRGARLPTPRAEAEPWEGPGAPGSLGCRAWRAWRRRRALRPAGLPGGCHRPRAHRVSQALGPRAAPVAPRGRAAACRARRPARRWLAVGGAGHACSWCAAGDAAAGSPPGPRPWHGGQHRQVGLGLRALCEGVRAVGPGLPGAPEVGDEGVPPEALGGEDAGRGGQRSGARDGLEAGGEDVGRAHGRGTAAACHRGAACEGHGVEGGGQQTRHASWRRADPLGPCGRARPTATGGPGSACGGAGPRRSSRQGSGPGADPPGVPGQRLGGSPRGASPPRRGPHRPPRRRRLVAAGVRSRGGVPWGPGPGLLALCEGLLVRLSSPAP